MAGSLPEPRTAAVRELRHPLSGDSLDRVLVLRFDAPASATGEDIVEFQCHGGRAVVAAVLDALTSLDCLREAEPGEFTRRSFENSRIDLTEAEGLADLIEAETESQRRAAIAVAEGGLRRQVEQWQGRLLDLSAQAERAIDYDEEDEAIDATLQRDCVTLADELASWLEQPRTERLRDGARVVVAGPPNAGKSSLLNAIAGEERAIVASVPGTTRDHIEVPLSLGGVPILLTDTAGLRESSDEVEAIGVGRTAALIKICDLLLWLGEPEQAPDHPKLVLVHSKVDIPGRNPAPRGTLAVSSLTGEGLGELMSHIKMCVLDLLPDENKIMLNHRQASHFAEAEDDLRKAAYLQDPVLVAEQLRRAREAFDRLTGRAGLEEVLDSLFARFCLGK